MGQSAEELRRDIERTREGSATHSTRSGTGSARAGSWNVARIGSPAACVRRGSG